jgi:hypothetical protein
MEKVSQIKKISTTFSMEKEKIKARRARYLYLKAALDAAPRVREALRDINTESKRKRRAEEE